MDSDAFTVFILEASPCKEVPKERCSFWAPVDLATGRPFGANQPRHIKLGPGQTVTTVVNPAGLRWERQILSTWPDRKLQEAVEPGTYRLYIEVERTPGANRVRSDGIDVLVLGGNIELGRSAP
jgi:hypothetical protein